MFSVEIYGAWDTFRLSFLESSITPAIIFTEENVIFSRVHNH